MRSVALRWVRTRAILIALLMLIALLVGCSAAEDEVEDRSEGTALDADPPRLPDPNPRRVDRPVYTPPERKKQDEVERYQVEEYRRRGYQIVDTTQTYLGDIVDWLDPSSVPGSQVQPPPRPSAASLRPGAGKELQRTELELYPELRGPEGTIPVFRHGFERYVRGETDATSLEDYLRNYNAPGQPAGQNRLYAGIGVKTFSKGASTWINSYGGTIEAGTMSLLEMAVVSRGWDDATTLELIGVAASRDRANFRDSVVRLQVEFLTKGFNTVGDDKGGWDGKFKGFKPAAGRPYGPGAALSPLSTINGTQYESKFEIMLFNGNWWVGHNGNWLGYYEGSKFSRLSVRADETLWYGEVFDPTPTNWTSTDMGSGLFASSGAKKAASFKNPTYTDVWGVSHLPTTYGNAPPNNTACYTRSDLVLGPPGSEVTVYVGGPGGDAAPCK